MRMIIERHQYAPELNRVHFVSRLGERLATMPAPGVTSHGQARAMFRPIKPTRVATVDKRYPSPLEGLNRLYIGRATYAEALQLAARVRAGMAPGGVTTVKTKLVG